MGPLGPADRGDGRLPVGVRVAPPAGPVGRRHDAPADGPPVHDRALPGAARPDPRGGPRDRALAPTSSSASAARPRPSTRPRSACSRPSATTRCSRPPTASAPGRPRRASPTTSRPPRSARRLNELLAVQEAIGLERNRAWLGRTTEVLVDTIVPRRHHDHDDDEAAGTAESRDAFADLPDGDVHLAGRSRENKLVHVAGSPELVGRLVRVRVDHAGPYALRGASPGAGRPQYAPSTDTRVPKSAGRWTPAAAVARQVASTMLSIGMARRAPRTRRPRASRPRRRARVLPRPRELLDREGHGGANGIEITRDEVRDDPPAVEAVDQDRRVGRRADARVVPVEQSPVVVERGFGPDTAHDPEDALAHVGSMARSSLDWAAMPTTAPRDLAPLVVIGGPTATGKTGLAIALAEWLIARGTAGRDRLGRLAAGVPRPRHRDGQGDGRRAGAGRPPRPRPRRPGRAVQRGRVPRPCARGAAGARRRGGIGILAGGTGFWLRAVMARPRHRRAAVGPGRPRVDRGRPRRRRPRRPRRPPDRGCPDRWPPAPTCATPGASCGPSRSRRSAATRTCPGAVGYPAPVLGLQLAVEPAEHRRRIADRAHAQFDAGLIEEARALRERYDPGAPGVLGDRLPRELGRARRRARRSRRPSSSTRSGTPQFARRQRTWFRREPVARGPRRGRGPVAGSRIARLERFVDRLARTPPAGILTTP